MVCRRHNPGQTCFVTQPFNEVLPNPRVLDQAREPLPPYKGRELSTSLSLRYNHFQPHLELSLRLAPLNKKKVTQVDLANLHISTNKEEGLDKHEDKEIIIKFTRGTQISLYTKAKSDHHVLSSSPPLCLDDLPKATKDAMSQMRTPVALELAGGKHEILTINLSINYPAWAERVRKMVFSDGRMMLLVDVDHNTLKLEQIRTYMEAKANPLEKFCPTGLNAPNRYDPLHFTANPLPSEYLGYRASPVFKDLQEYTIAGLAAIELDRQPEVRQIKALEDSRKRLILLDFEGEKLGKEYEGLLTKPAGHEFKLQPDQSFEIHFTPPRFGIPPWRATVMPEGTVKKKGMLSIHVHRGQYKNSLKYAENQPRTFDVTKLSDEQIRERVKEKTKDSGHLPGNTVSIKLIDPNSVYPNTRASMVTPPYSSRMKEVMLGLRPDQLEFMDLYQHIKDEIPDLEKYMAPLNMQQSQLVMSARHIRGGILIGQGPPGTGKTRTAKEMAIPFLVSKLAYEKKLIVLIAAPTNAGADDLMHGVYSGLRGAQEMDPALKVRTRYILRVYPEKAEDQISRSQGPVPADGLPKDKTKGHSGSSGHDGTPVKRKMFQEFRAADKPRFDGIRDRRVTDIEHSVGYMRLLISGAIPGSEHAWPDANRFADFRHLHGKQKLGEMLTVVEETTWKQESDELTKLALRGAAAIVSTTATISKAALLNDVKDKVAAVFLDESAFEREDNLRPLLGAAFKLEPCFVLIGDQMQLSPITKADLEENDFKPQLELSFMTRMIDIGMNYTMLTQQYRMVPEISAIANEMTYDNKLVDSPCSALENRPLAQKFREFTKQHYKIETNRFMIDMPPSKTNIAMKNVGKSKSNDFSICVVAQLIVELCDHFGAEAKIGILTPYGGQRYKYRRMEGNMRKAKLKNLDKVTILTVDGAQGQEFDIVVLDLVVSKSAGFLEEEKRLNVALTRARDGLIVVCDKIRIKTAFYKKPWPNQYMKKMMPLFDKHTWTREHDDGFPQTEYYTPSNPESPWKEDSDIESSDEETNRLLDQRHA